MVRRFDASTIAAKRDAAGIMRGVANLTRVGVLVYRNADGTARRELRHPDEVFASKSLDTLSLVPMTLGHPSDGAVTSKNAKRSVIGAIGETVKNDSRFVRAPFMIHDDAAIEEIESGRQRDLSCGYNCDLDFTPGVYNGEPYDAVQRNIEYNHVAVLAKGRAGPEVRIDGDAESDLVNDSDSLDTPAPRAQKEDKAMKTIKLDGIDYTVDSPAFDQAFAKYTASNDAKIVDLTKQVTDAKAEADKQKGRADAAEASLKTAKEEATPEAIAKRVAARVAVESHGARVLGKTFKADGKSDDEIRRAVILKVTPQAKLDGMSADYVQARFDHVTETFKQDAADASLGALRTDLAELDNEDAEDDLDDAKSRNAMIERNRKLSQGKSA